MNWVYEILNKGDLIRVKRTFYYHYGIYIGNGKVIHFSGENNDSINTPNDVTVRISSIDMFASNAMVEKAIFTFKEKLFKRNARSILKKANSHLGEKGYNFISNNCENFAYSCVFRKKVKTQVDSLKDIVDGIVK